MNEHFVPITLRKRQTVLGILASDGRIVGIPETEKLDHKMFGKVRSLKTDYSDEATNHCFDVETMSQEHGHSEERPSFGEVNFNFSGFTIPDHNRTVHIKRMDTPIAKQCILHIEPFEVEQRHRWQKEASGIL